jgi:hypothetical protein
VGYVPKHGVTMVWGTNEGVGGWGGMGKDLQTTTQKCEKTTKKWVVDNLARGRREGG